MGKMKEVFILKQEHIKYHPEDKDKPDEFFIKLYLDKLNKKKNK